MLKTTGSVAGLASVAGCTSGGNDGGQDAGTTTVKDKNVDIEGTTIKYWSTYATHSDAAKKQAKNVIKRFEEETGAKVQLNPITDPGAAPSKWATTFKQGNYPVLHDIAPHWAGLLLKGGWDESLDNLWPRLSENTRSSLEWLKPTMKYTHKGLKNTKLGYTIPVGIDASPVMAVRTDHMKAAGLNPDKDFPPKSFEHAVEVGKALQQDGPGEWGFQMLGSQGDILDVYLPQWAMAYGGLEKGSILQPDWSDVNFGNKHWKKAFGEYVSVYREHGLSNESTPTFGDEALARQLTAGKISMGGLQVLSYPILQKNGAEMIKNDKIRLSTSWGGPKGQPAHRFLQGMAITKKPKGVSEDKWYRKQEAAIKFVDMWLEEAVQQKVYGGRGAVPANKSVWSKISEQSPVFDTFTEAVTATDHAFSAHPEMRKLIWYGPYTHFQKALKGNLTPEEACNKAQKDGQKLLENSSV